MTIAEDFVSHNKTSKPGKLCPTSPFDCVCVCVCVCACVCVCVCDRGPRLLPAAGATATVPKRRQGLCLLACGPAAVVFVCLSQYSMFYVAALTLFFTNALAHNISSTTLEHLLCLHTTNCMFHA